MTLNHFQWRVRSVLGGTSETFVKRLEETLNQLESEGYAIDEIERTGEGAIIVGKKPRAMPST